MGYKPEPLTNQGIQIGSRVRCLKPVDFVDGTTHGLNDEILVTRESLAYFRHWTDNRHYEEL